MVRCTQQFLFRRRFSRDTINLSRLIGFRGMEDNDVDSEQPELNRTLVAERVAKLKEAALRAVNSRRKVPHTLFWSLLRTQVADIKEEKKRERIRRSLL